MKHLKIAFSHKAQFYFGSMSWYNPLVYRFSWLCLISL